MATAKKKATKKKATKKKATKKKATRKKATKKKRRQKHVAVLLNNRQADVPNTAEAMAPAVASFVFEVVFSPSEQTNDLILWSN